jgi:UTP-glucose-1-phosphate uridylyltransferase
LILAAGAGQRFGGCKQLTPVGPGDKTLMDHVVGRARQAGFGRIVVVTRPELEPATTSHLAAAGETGIELVHQARGTFGTVPAVLSARPLLQADEPFAVVNADDLYPFGALRALRDWSGPDHALLGFRLRDTLLREKAKPVNRALCRTDEGGRLLELSEMAIVAQDDDFVARPTDGTHERVVTGEHIVSMNAWALRPSIWAHLERAQIEGEGEILLPVILGAAVARGSVAVTVIDIVGSCVGLTWPEDLEPMRAHVAGCVAR